MYPDIADHYFMLWIYTKILFGRFHFLSPQIQFSKRKRRKRISSRERDFILWIPDLQYPLEINNELVYLSDLEDQLTEVEDKRTCGLVV